MSDHARAFLDDVLPRIKAADADLHNGDPAARGAMWSRNEPVTLFGAAFTVAGLERDPLGVREACGRSSRTAAPSRSRCWPQTPEPTLVTSWR